MDRQIEIRERLFEQVTTSFEQFVLRRFPEKERQQIQELLRQSIALELEMSLREGERHEQTQ
jgi:peptidyl-tRNA hydrolase